MSLKFLFTASNKCKSEDKILIIKGSFKSNKGTISSNLSKLSDRKGVITKMIRMYKMVSLYNLKVSFYSITKPNNWLLDDKITLWNKTSILYDLWNFLFWSVLKWVPLSEVFSLRANWKRVWHKSSWTIVIFFKQILYHSA